MGRQRQNTCNVKGGSSIPTTTIDGNMETYYSHSRRKRPSSNKHRFIIVVCFLLAVGVQLRWILFQSPTTTTTTTNTLTSGLMSQRAPPLNQQQRRQRRQQHQHAATLDGSDPNTLDRIIIVPEHKLYFCWFGKVGCSMFNHLWRMVRLLHHPSIQKEEAKFQAKFTWRRNTPSHHNLTVADLEDIVNDPKWTKAVFYRDPVSRFVSAFQSKCGFGDNMNGRKHCIEAFGRNVTDGSIESFHTALDIINEHPEQVFSNTHWKPMNQHCGGLKTSIDQFQFVHQLDPKTSGRLIRDLLTNIGVESNLTDDLIEYVVRTGGTYRLWEQEQVRQKFGLKMGFSATNRRRHNTGKIFTLSEYFNDDLEKLRSLQSHYEDDYLLFDLPHLGFDGKPLPHNY